MAGAREGDEACLALIGEEADYLGQAFAGLIHLFSPERIIMGGGVSNAFDLMSDRIHAVIGANDGAVQGRSGRPRGAWRQCRPGGRRIAVARPGGRPPALIAAQDDDTSTMLEIPKAPLTGARL